MFCCNETRPIHINIILKRRHEEKYYGRRTHDFEMLGYLQFVGVDLIRVFWRKAYNNEIFYQYITARYGKLYILLSNPITLVYDSALEV